MSVYIIMSFDLRLDLLLSYRVATSFRWSFNRRPKSLRNGSKTLRRIHSCAFGFFICLHFSLFVRATHQSSSRVVRCFFSPPTLSLAFIFQLLRIASWQFPTSRNDFHSCSKIGHVDGSAFSRWTMHVVSTRRSSSPGRRMRSDVLSARWVSTCDISFLEKGIAMPSPARSRPRRKRRSIVANES